jgi:hypothetical protein
VRYPTSERLLRNPVKEACDTDPFSLTAVQVAADAETTGESVAALVIFP